MGSTHAGPHRGDLKLKLDERQARKLVSRGQQKLLACALILSATGVVQTHLDHQLLLLLDDPAAVGSYHDGGPADSSIPAKPCFLTPG